MRLSAPPYSGACRNAVCSAQLERRWAPEINADSTVARSVLNEVVSYGSASTQRLALSAASAGLRTIDFERAVSCESGLITSALTGIAAPIVGQPFRVPTSTRGLATPSSDTLPGPSRSHLNGGLFGAVQLRK